MKSFGIRVGSMVLLALVLAAGFAAMHTASATHQGTTIAEGGQWGNKKAPASS